MRPCPKGHCDDALWSLLSRSTIRLWILLACLRVLDAQGCGSEPAGEWMTRPNHTAIGILVPLDVPGSDVQHLQDQQLVCAGILAAADVSRGVSQVVTDMRDLVSDLHVRDECDPNPFPVAQAASPTDGAA